MRAFESGKENSVSKTAKDPGCEAGTAPAWTISARNSLLNSFGFSPNQLAFVPRRDHYELRKSDRRGVNIDLVLTRKGIDDTSETAAAGLTHQSLHPRMPKGTKTTGTSTQAHTQHSHLGPRTNQVYRRDQPG